jgi:putative FmdB family regulatory protein
MPTYEYACRDCGQHVEVVQSFRDEPLTVCPNCEGRLRKVYGTAGIIFKGSGYYVTDSRASSGSKSGSEATKESTPAESTKSGSGTDKAAGTPSSGDSSGGGETPAKSA